MAGKGVVTKPHTGPSRADRRAYAKAMARNPLPTPKAKPVTETGVETATPLPGTDAHAHPDTLADAAAGLCVDGVALVPGDSWGRAVPGSSNGVYTGSSGEFVPETP